MNEQLLQTAESVAARAAQSAETVKDRVVDTAKHVAEQGTELCNATTNEVENFVRKHPVWAVTATVGLGYLAGMLVKELLTPPPPPKHRAVRILEDIQERLTDLVGPAYERASRYADDGLSAVKSGVKNGTNSLNDLKLGDRIRHLFS